MKRREFVSRVALGSAAAACASLAKPAAAAAATGQLNVRFVGMMTFVERNDRSFLVATPGEGHHQVAHVPFLMARSGSSIAKALNMTPATGVMPAAFDTELDGSRSSDFVFRSLNNTAIEIVAGTRDAVNNQSTQMAQLQDIAPGKRLRGNLEKWAAATISLRGGTILDSAAHPDAGKVWSFGSYRQRLTDAANFRTDGQAASLRLTSGTEATSVAIPAGETSELWVISSAAMNDRMNDPAKLVHSELLFDYLVDAKPVIAECPDAVGREVPPTALPFTRPTSGSNGIIASGSMVPPFSDLCFMAAMLLGPKTTK